MEVRRPDRQESDIHTPGFRGVQGPRRTHLCPSRWAPGGVSVLDAFKPPQGPVELRP